MAVQFLDSSAITRLYVAETGSQWVRQLVRSEDVAVSELAHVEMSSVFARRVRGGSLTVQQRDAL